jgi:benzoyl-CoA reductase/2-hydroxyglutaryl-CoA dehydratase subunit BcrC/BadD/HgdB
MPKRVGITTTLPVEAIFAAGMVPVDLNNRFVNHSDPNDLIAFAENQGFAPGVCAWIKGLYAVAIGEQIDSVVAVVHGDCANTVALGEVLAHRGVPVTRFAFPLVRSPETLRDSISSFARDLGAEESEVKKWKTRLDRIREKLVELDERTWKTGQVTGAENHLHLVGSSDFNGDPDRFEKDLDAFLEQARMRPENHQELTRIGVIGVPTILTDLYGALEKRGMQVVFNEVPRQFAMPSLLPTLEQQYANYTYPFDLNYRIDDIAEEIERRDIHGLVHYIQSFCHRQIEDIVIRDRLSVPILTIEGDRPGPTDGRTLTRLDAFLEMLRGS